MASRTSQKHRRLTYTAGKRAEGAALVYMMCKGYRPVARRFKCPSGEIDLILTRNNVVVFVEVKYRAKIDDAAFSITPKQRLRITRAARYWVAANARKYSGDMRFDVLLLCPWRWPVHLEHAFVDNHAN